MNIFWLLKGGINMVIEIIVTLTIVTTAAYILYKNMKKKGIGQCDCGSCSSHCPKYEKPKK